MPVGPIFNSFSQNGLSFQSILYQCHFVKRDMNKFIVDFQLCYYFSTLTKFFSAGSGVVL